MWICSLMSLKLSMSPLFTITKSCQLFTHHLGGQSCRRCRKFEKPKILVRSQSPLHLPLTPGIHKNPKRTWAPTERGIYLGYTWDVRSWGDSQLTGGYTTWKRVGPSCSRGRGQSYPALQASVWRGWRTGDPRSSPDHGNDRAGLSGLWGENRAPKDQLQVLPMDFLTRGGLPRWKAM